jgi:hypothetical protein
VDKLLYARYLIENDPLKSGIFGGGGGFFGGIRIGYIPEIEREVLLGADFLRNMNELVTSFYWR